MANIPPMPESIDMDNPLSTEQLDSLAAAVDLGDSVQPLIARANAAGIDLGGIPQQISDETARARRILQTFDPGRSA